MTCPICNRYFKPPEWCDCNIDPFAPDYVGHSEEKFQALKASIKPNITPEGVNRAALSPYKGIKG